MSTAPGAREERRRERRFRITLPLEYVCSGRMLAGKGELRDISVTGMYVEDAHHDLELGDVVRAPLWLFDGETTVFLKGRVVRAESGGFAVRFEERGTESLLRQMLPLAEESPREP